LKYILLFILVIIFYGCGTISPNIEKIDLSNIYAKVVNSDNMKYEGKKAFLSLETNGHLSKINDVLVTHDKSKIITASSDGTVKIWNIKNSKLIKRINVYRNDIGYVGINAISIDKNDKYLYVAGTIKNEKSKYYAIQVYNINTGKMIKNIEVTKYPIKKLQLIKSDNYLVVSSFDGNIYIWDLYKNILKDIIEVYKKPNGAYYSSIYWHKNKKRLEISTYNGALVYSLDSFSELFRIKKELTFISEKASNSKEKVMTMRNKLIIFYKNKT